MKETTTATTPRYRYEVMSFDGKRRWVEVSAQSFEFWKRHGGVVRESLVEESTPKKTNIRLPKDVIINLANGKFEKVQIRKKKDWEKFSTKLVEIKKSRRKIKSIDIVKPPSVKKTKNAINKKSIKQSNKSKKVG